MGPKSRFQLNILGLTLVMIAGLTGAFMSGMYLFLDGVTPVRIVALILGLSIGVVALLRMMKLNQEEVKGRIDKAEEEYHEFMDRWTIGPQQWSQFVQERLKHDKGESNGYGYATGGVFTFLTALIGFSFFKPEVLMVVLAGTFLFFFHLGKWAHLLGARRRFERDSGLTQSYAHFAEKLVVLNGQLIMIDDFGVRLKSFELLERFGMKILSFKVETGLGNRRSQTQYSIPVPEGKETAGEELVGHYAGLIS